MIFISQNYERVEIKIKGIHSGELLIAELNVIPKHPHSRKARKPWKTEIPLLTITEAENFYSWIKKFARKNGYYKSKLVFEKAGLQLAAVSDKKKGKELIVQLTGPCKPEFIKNEAYSLKAKISDTALVKMAYQLKEQIKDYTKPGFEERTGLTKDEIDNLTLTDTERFAEGSSRKEKTPDKTAAQFTGITIKAEIKHHGNESLAIDPQEAFWYPFRISAAKKAHNGNIMKAPAAEQFEAALRNNFPELLVNNFIEYFRKSFFEFDAEYKKIHPEYKPGRIDEMFITYYEDEPLYKEYADKLVNSAYLHASGVGIQYDPVILSFNMSSFNSLFMMFDYKRDKLMYFMKKFVPPVFISCLHAIDGECLYDDIKLEFSFTLITQHGKSLPKNLNHWR